MARVGRERSSRDMAGEEKSESLERVRGMPTLELKEREDELDMVKLAEKRDVFWLCAFKDGDNFESKCVRKRGSEGEKGIEKTDL